MGMVRPRLKCNEGSEVFVALPATEITFKIKAKSILLFCWSSLELFVASEERESLGKEGERPSTRRSPHTQTHTSRHP